jgi:hypothetical protein
MSLLSYQLSLKKYQRELGLDARTFNALDRKHNDVNLLKQLQLLNPVIAVPASASATGFYGTFTIRNEKVGASDPKWIEIKLEYNNINIVTQIIYSDTTEVLTIPIGSRLPLPSSILQMKTRIEGPMFIISGTDITNLSGFTSLDAITGNDPTDENIFEALIDSAFIDGGNLTLDFGIDTR